MNIADFQREAPRTISPVEPILEMALPEIDGALKVMLMTLGMAGESGEVYQVAFDYAAATQHDRGTYTVFGGEWMDKMVKEMGDVAWYCVNMMTLFQIDAYMMMMRESTLRTVLNSSFKGDVRLHAVTLATMMTLEATKLAEVVKKAVFHGHGINSRAIMRHTGEIFNTLQILAAVIGTDIETVFQRNVEKLAARYPEKFETFLSLNAPALWNSGDSFDA